MHAPGVFRLCSLILILVAAVLRPAQAEETGRVVELLDLPRHAALMRHATAPGSGDPDHFRLDDCTTQRNLSETGRAEARETGRLLRAAGLADALVLTSRWCRATDTARELDLGEVDPFPPLDSFFRDRSREDAARRDILARNRRAQGRRSAADHGQPPGQHHRRHRHLPGIGRDRRGRSAAGRNRRGAGAALPLTARPASPPSEPSGCLP